MDRPLAVLAILGSLTFLESRVQELKFDISTQETERCVNSLIHHLAETLQIKEPFKSAFFLKTTLDFICQTHGLMITSVNLIPDPVRYTGPKLV